MHGCNNGILLNISVDVLHHQHNTKRELVLKNSCHKLVCSTGID